MSPDVDLDQLRAMFKALGVTRAYYKWLAPNDNSKNQVYLGGSYEALNLLPVGPIRTEVSERGRQVMKAPVRLEWLSAAGTSVPAPNSQLILYPQYPEVRLSGFLRGCEAAPTELLMGRAEGRVLFLGVIPEGRIVAHAVAHDSRIASQLGPKPPGDPVVFNELPLATRPGTTGSEQQLILELARIHALGWIDSKRLDSAGRLLPCNSEHCGGYTLEAELGVRPNGIAEPDYLGWEIKAHTVSAFGAAGSPLTLMTPEPDGGVYRVDGAEAFVRRFGYPDRAGRANRQNFGGIYRCGRRVPLTGLTLTLDGFDAKRRLITKASGGIHLVNDDGVIAAEWGFAKLMGHWNRKHAHAAYIEMMKRLDPHRQYSYGSDVKLGQDSDFSFFLGALSAGDVYYDPALKLVDDPSEKTRVKRRNQFRVKFGALETLYRDFKGVDVTSP